MKKEKKERKKEIKKERRKEIINYKSYYENEICIYLIKLVDLEVKGNKFLINLLLINIHFTPSIPFF